MSNLKGLLDLDKKFSALNLISIRKLEKLLKKTENVELLLSLREGAKDIDGKKTKLIASRINEISFEKFSDDISLAIDYRFLPNEIARSGYSLNKNIYPEILKVFNYFPRAVIEYMNLYMQFCIYPIFINEEKTKIRFNNELSNVYLFPFITNKEEIYNKDFLENKVKNFCNKKDLTYVNYELSFFYDMRNYKEYEFKILMVLFISIKEKEYLFSPTEITGESMLEEKILNIIKKEKLLCGKIY